MITAKQAHLHAAAQSNKGMVRQNNEDNFAVSAYQLSQTDPTPVVFAILSDGIGGHNAGEVASEMVVNRFTAWVGRSDGTRPLEVLKSAFDETNLKVVTASQSSPERKGMGATLICVWVIGRRLYTASAGDSRIYLVRGEAIQQLSLDHTWIQEAIDKGQTDLAQMNNLPSLHVIRRYVGSEKEIEPDFRMRLKEGESNAEMLAHQGMPLLPGDLLLLCSDGLTDMVTNEEMIQVMHREKNLRASVDELVNLANTHGGKDNITVMMLMMPWDADKQEWFK